MTDSRTRREASRTASTACSKPDSPKSMAKGNNGEVASIEADTLSATKSTPFKL